MPHTRPQSVVVIGAGVTGLSTAFHLAEKGVERVVVVDKGEVGGGSSLQAGGIITMLMGTETEVRARAISLDLFERFSRILDGYQFHQVGCLNMSPQAGSDETAPLRDMWRRLGGQFDVLRGEEITERFPDLVADENDAGVLDLRSGYSEPHRYVPALRARVEDMGVEIRENEPVVGFDIRDGCARGVVTAGGAIEADATVAAVNAWTNHVLASVGYRTPHKNFVHERFVTRPFPEPPRLPAVNDHINNCYVRPTDDNRLLFGTSVPDLGNYDMRGPDFAVSELDPHPGARPFIEEHMAERVPKLQGAEWDYHTVGLISFAYDVKPVIGPVPGVDGLYVGAHFHSGGFAYNPVSGLLVAEHVVDGGTRIDSELYSPARFGDVDTDAYLAERMLHDDMTHGVRH